MTLNMQTGRNPIGWTKTILPDGTEIPGATWNPVAGCPHQCAWEMPNGVIANCYAEDTATRLRAMSEKSDTPLYEYGFDAHYWYPNRLDSPRKKKTPLKIFVGSMSDVFAHRVPGEQIESILQVARDCPQHTFQFLTKNPIRTKHFEIPDNVWLGASMPPDFMWGKKLSQTQKERMLHRSLKALAEANATVKWMSFEPLSWDVSEILSHYPNVLQWAVIGAASNGATLYPPSLDDFTNLQTLLDNQSVATFYKGNLRSLKLSVWREDFPMTNLPSIQLPLL